MKRGAEWWEPVDLFVWPGFRNAPSLGTPVRGWRLTWGQKIEEPVVDVSKDPTYPYSVCVRGEIRGDKRRASYFCSTSCEEGL